MKDGPWWQLDAERINSLQQESIAALVRRCKAAHFVDVHVRINGKWEVYQADWIKHLKTRPRPILATWREIVWRLRCRFSWLWTRKAKGNGAENTQSSTERGDSEHLEDGHA